MKPQNEIFFPQSVAYCNSFYLCTMQHQNTLAYAQELDKQDVLHSFRDKFHIPQHNGKDVVYFTGNSLGLQPKTTETYIQQELNDWKKYGVEGHFLAKNR